MDINVVQTPLFNRVENVPRRLDINLVAKLHYINVNSRIIFLALFGKILDGFHVGMEKSQKILQHFSGIVVDNSDKAFITRRFGDTASVWFSRVADDTYILDLSDPDMYGGLAFTTGASYVRSKTYFTNEQVQKITLIDDTGEYDYTPPNPSITDNNTVYKWIIAKAYVEATSMQLNLQHHTLFCHFLTQWFNVSMHRTMRADHPLLKILEPYYDKNIALEGLTKIAGFDFFYEKDMTQAHLDIRSMHVFFERMMRKMHKNDFYDIDILRRLEDNNFTHDTIPDYYKFAVAMVRYYDIERELIVKIINEVYPTEEDLQNDPEINAWWRYFYQGIGNMKISNNVLDKNNLLATLMILVSIILDHGLEHATAGLSFASAFELPLRVKESRANLNDISDLKKFYFKKVIGGSVYALSQAAISKGYATSGFTGLFKKQYRMWGNHVYHDLTDYKAKLEAFQVELRAEGSYYVIDNVPMSVRD